MTQPAGRPPRPYALLAPWPFLVLWACGTGVAPKTPQSTPFVPFGEAAAEPDALQFEPSLLGLANLDDDDQDGLSDWEDDAVAGEDDTLPLRLEPTLWPADEALTFSLTGDLSQLRVWSDGALLLSADAPTAILPRPDSPLTLDIELGDYNVAGLLTVERSDARAEVQLASAPLILNHHLQGTLSVVAMEDSRGANEEYIATFEEALSDRFTPAPLSDYGGDVWVQDEIEFGTSTTPTRAMEVVIDSVRSGNGRYLDDIAEDLYLGPDFASATWGSGRTTSQDSFGNLEVSPPVTVNGVEYPFGRIYWGENGGQGITDGLAELLEAQVIQDPFQIDISMLCVGHVDEITSAVPDATAPRGFRFLIADTALGRDLVMGLDPGSPIPQYRRAHDYQTVGEMQDDLGLWTYNEEFQVGTLDPALAIFIEELGLLPEEIIHIPALFEESRACAGGGLSLVPGTVNLVVAQAAGSDDTHVFMADPFFRDADAGLDEDPFVQAVEALLPPDLLLHWSDDWDSYHELWGEVHCGSNTRRPAAGPWWDETPAELR